MRSLAMALFLAIPLTATAIPTQGVQERARPRIRVTLVNTSRGERHVVLADGGSLSFLPGQTAVIESCIGCSIRIESSTDSHVRQAIPVAAHTANRVVPVV